ncbi:MAG: hypothetical protein E4H11_07140, partial [Myxococcales bacterium]
MPRPNAMLSIPRCVGVLASALLCLGIAPGARASVSHRQRGTLRGQARAFDHAHRFDTRSDPANGAVIAARNPDQAMELRFSAQGLELREDPATSPIGLRLARAGAADALVAVPPALPVASGARVEYRRGASIEWYRNGANGLEQGFRFEAPVPGALELAVELELAAAARQHERAGATLAGRIVSRIAACGPSTPAVASSRHASRPRARACVW